VRNYYAQPIRYTCKLILWITSHRL